MLNNFRIKMPFTEAVLDEIHRLLSVAPVLPHKTTADVTLGGYHLPKNTPVSSIVALVLADKLKYSYSLTAETLFLLLTTFLLLFLHLAGLYHIILFVC